MSFRTENTITKVVVVLLITLGVLGAISYFSFKSYEQFSGAVDKLYNQEDKTTLTENILTDVGELESRSRAYSLTMSREDAEMYLQKAEDIQKNIDSLYESSYNKNYHNEADTLRSLFQQKIESFRNLIDLKINLANKQYEHSAYKALVSTQRTINKDSILVPKQEITTTTITRVENPETPKDEDKGGWFNKIFGKKEKEESKPPVRSEIREEKVIAYDSAYFQKVDTLITSVKKALSRAESQRRLQSERLTESELATVANDQVIIDKLRTIILKIKELETKNAIEEKKGTLVVARSSFTSVIIFAICGGLLSIILIFFVINDILRSNRMQAELSIEKKKAEKLANVKEEFLANMSHEIRTPLNAIIGFAEQLAGSSLNNEQQSKLQKVRSSGEHLLMLVNDILDYSKIESGKLRLEKIGFKIEAIINESLVTLEHLANAKGIELRCEIEESLKSFVLKGDPIRLKQILINLAGNGVKFTENGYVKISAGIERDSGESIQVKLIVEDTGKGISPSKMERIFDSFDQEDTSISRRFGGTGLGLSISKKLVHLQKGHISVESEPGEGSVFKVLLDYEIAEKDDYSGKFDPEKVEINLEGHSLLLIDDDSMNHVLLKPSFKRWGLHFDSAYNGEDGIKMASKRRYDFILVDLQMPGKSGVKVVEDLRAPDAASHDSAIILCTANAMIKSSRASILRKVDATLLKPFKEYEVAAILAGVSSPNISIGQAETEAEFYTLTNFKAFAGDDLEVLRQFLQSFITTNTEHLELLEKYFEEGDYINVGDTAHKMKNTFGQLRANEVMAQLIELEKLVVGKQPRKLIRERIDKTRLHAHKIFEQLVIDLEKLDVQGQTSNP